MWLHSGGCTTDRFLIWPPFIIWRCFQMPMQPTSLFCTAIIAAYYPRQSSYSLNISCCSHQVGPRGHRPFNFSNNENKCVFSKRTTKVCISYSQWCPRTAASSMPYLWVYLYLWSWGSNVWHEVESPWRRLCQLKKPFKGLKRSSCLQDRNDILFFRGRFIALASWPIKDFFLSAPLPNIWLRAPSLAHKIYLFFLLHMSE